MESLLEKQNVVNIILQNIQIRGETGPGPEWDMTPADQDEQLLEAFNEILRRRYSAFLHMI
jgi:hypothetical protein